MKLALRNLAIMLAGYVLIAGAFVAVVEMSHVEWSHDATDSADACYGEPAPILGDDC